MPQTPATDQHMKNLELYLLRFGAIQTLAMAVYHFFLPMQFGWAEYVPESAPTIGWALFALNAYFSFNLLVMGGFFAYFVFTKPKGNKRVLTFAMMVLLFWLFSFAYQLIRPMPLPENLNWLSYLLPGLALANAMIIGVPTIRIMMRKRQG
ncbi:MAG: hypothetical protein O7G85_02075 [Planctomycetota bacterium]|nr:hypothetical protein [Planctomycetota bacterium]